MGFFKQLAKVFSYNDGSYDRAAMGELAAYTGPNGVLSPAQAGMRAIGADGNAIFDSLGLIGVASIIASNNFTATDTSSIGAWVKATGSDSVFMVPRRQRVIAFYAVHGWMSVGNQSGQVRMNIGGTVSQRMTFATVDARDTSASGFLFVTLDPGVYTAQTEISLQGGAGTVHMHEGENVVILLGY